MIGKALKKIVEELNTFLEKKYGSSNTGYRAEIKNIDKSADPGIRVALINVEEDKVYKNHLNPSTIVNSGIHSFGGTPVMRVNLYVLFAFNPKIQQDSYLDSLSLLTNVLSYFAGTPYQEIVIPKVTTPILIDEKRFRLEINYHNISLEDSNNMWSNLGGEQKPYAMYQIKMLEIEADKQIEVTNDKILKVAPIISSPDLDSDGKTIFKNDYPKNDTNEIKHKD